MSADSAPVPTPAPLPEPAPGSIHFFTLLYSPRERRVALRTLLALADEIGAGVGRQLDHGVAHLRLDWWRREAQRLAAGSPAHPWLIAWQRERFPPLDLAALIDAAAIDLASERLAASGTQRLPQALFVLAATVLAADTSAAALVPQQRDLIAALGRSVDTLEHPQVARTGQPDSAQRLRLDPALQRALAPLLVWAALAACHARRRERRATRKSPTMAAPVVDGLADNLIAWQAARTARRGYFRLEDLQT